MAYLRVEKPCFLFLEGSVGAKAMAVAATVAATVVPPDAPAARAGTSAARSASSVDRPAVGASAPDPGTCSSAASVALGEGAQAPTSQGGGAAPHHFPSHLLHLTTSIPASLGERVPAARAARTLRPSTPSVLVAGSPVPSCAPPAPVPAAAPRARARALGVGGSDRAVFTATLLGRTKRQSCGSA
jgi:hypothetical protein